LWTTAPLSPLDDSREELFVGLAKIEPCADKSEETSIGEPWNVKALFSLALLALERLL
jgi:hypothetical protein